MNRIRSPVQHLLSRCFHTFHRPTDPYMIISKPVGVFQMNQYAIVCRESREGAIIDSGDTSPTPWIEWAKKHHVTLKYLLQTHAHIDHVCGLAETKEALPDAMVALHPADSQLYDLAIYQILHMGLGIRKELLDLLPKTPPKILAKLGKAYGIPCRSLPKVDLELSDNMLVQVGKLSFTVLHTPGHCPGHVCFYEKAHDLMFGGDLLFMGSIGRTDFPHSDPRDMVTSLKRILTLPDNTVVFPGHNDPTTLAAERQSNPFLQPDFLSSPFG